MGPRFRVSSERLEKPGIEPMTPGLEGEQLNHYTTEASQNDYKHTQMGLTHKLLLVEGLKVVNIEIRMTCTDITLLRQQKADKTIQLYTG